ncbi:MAG: hypothetical protein ISR65_17975 [Bacteriovoracaceae bacterium]|nr:hypothetical protein [Bacteriovoracaceae bacterium]
MEKTNFFRIVFLVSALIAVSACNKLTKGGKSDKASNDLALKTATEALVNGEHTVEYKTTGLHYQAYKKDRQKCKTCHGDDYTGGNVKKDISCNKCHMKMPHSEDDTFKATKGAHGKIYLQDKKECAKCHNVESSSGVLSSARPGVAPKKECKTCHNFPHLPGWKMKQEHGAKHIQEQASAPKDVSCKGCHKLQWAQDAKKTCTTCHKYYPHDEFSDFKTSSFHGAKYLENRAECIKCHKVIPDRTTFTKAMLTAAEGHSETPTDCSKCHNYPHPPAWVTSGKHWKEFRKERKSPLPVNCLSCHAQESSFNKRYAINVTCKSCHMQMPHPKTPKNFKTIHKKNKTYKVITKQEWNTCGLCHKEVSPFYKGKIEQIPSTHKKNCSKCHEDYVLNFNKQDKKWEWLDCDDDDNPLPATIKPFCCVLSEEENACKDVLTSFKKTHKKGKVRKIASLKKKKKAAKKKVKKGKKTNKK